jgi:hypothetical protein
MKFPLRLSVDLLGGKLLRGFSAASALSMIHHLSPSLFSASNQEEIDAESDPNAALMEIPASMMAQTSAPILWIGGQEPLQHPVIGRVAAALNSAGRNVFLHTDGLQLRRRIHEFRPDPRLFLTVEFAGCGKLHDHATEPSGAFRRRIEGIRAAKLSGFHVCTHVTVNEQTQVCETGELFESLDQHDVDGYIVSSAGAADVTSDSPMKEKLEEIRALVRCARWESFSKLLEASYVSVSRRADLASVPVTVPATIPSHDAEAVEESV